jgi:glycosyltransferase involved in cell wall biosynthesis
MANIQASVIVSTCHSDRELDICLAALVAQNFDHTRFEIIVVDLGNRLATHALVHRWIEATTAYQIPAPVAFAPLEPNGKGTALSVAVKPVESQPVLTYLPQFRYIPLYGEDRNPTRAWNAGWRAAQGSLIAFTEPDCIPGSNWLRRGVETLQEGYDAVTGQIDIPLSDTPTDYEINARALMASEFMIANCFFRKSVLEARGGFDEDFSTGWRADTDLYFRLLDANANLRMISDALVLRPVQRAKWWISLKQQRKNYHDALLYKKHPRLYQKKIGHSSPLQDYASILSILAVLVGLISGAPAWALAGLVAWLFVTLWNAGDRLKSTTHRPGHMLEILVTSALIPFFAIYWRIRGSLAFKVWHL